MDGLSLSCVYFHSSQFWVGWPRFQEVLSTFFIFGPALHEVQGWEAERATAMAHGQKSPRTTSQAGRQPADGAVSIRPTPPESQP